MGSLKIFYETFEIVVSIIIPYYNRISNVESAVKSVFSQSNTEWELFLIDDCSNEDNGSILKYKEGPQGQLIHHRRNEVNRGPGYSRNCGIKEACGEYLVFLDSDDILKDTYLEKMIREITSDLLFVYCNASWVDGTIYKNSDVSHQSVLPTLIQYGRPWHTVSIFWNKLYVPFFDEELRSWEDYLFEFTAALTNNRITHINEVLVLVGKVGELSLSSHSGTLTGWLNKLKAIDRMLAKLEFTGLFRNIKLVCFLLLKYTYFAIRLQNVGNSTNIKFNSKILRFIPSNVWVLKVLNKCLRIVK